MREREKFVNVAEPVSSSEVNNGFQFLTNLIVGTTRNKVKNQVITIVTLSEIISLNVTNTVADNVVQLFIRNFNADNRTTEHELYVVSKHCDILDSSSFKNRVVLTRTRIWRHRNRTGMSVRRWSWPSRRRRERSWRRWREWTRMRRERTRTWEIRRRNLNRISNKTFSIHFFVHTIFIEISVL